MDPWLICAALFLPLPWRFAVAFLFPRSQRPRIRLAVFVAPLVAIAAYFLIVACRSPEYHITLPVLLFGFWVPQFLLIAFFAMCEREQSRQSAREAGATAAR